MVDIGTARTIIGIVGENIISFSLFMSPILTFIKICKKKTGAGFKPTPYVVMVLNCALWVFYGMPIVRLDSLLIVTINGFGLGLALIYVGIFLIYSPWNIRVTSPTIDLRFAFVGTLCIIFNIVLHTSPLTIMRHVIQIESIKYMPFYLSLAYLLNIIWSVPNGLGALSGLMQLILYATYYRTTKWDEPEKPTSEVEISAA
ncbi:hypothetical protein ACJRO7_009517 [Eucalyptus globulus]|uniref:Bidirectional sugar transporter SWEET n=1 Tax=Eucalyptus globulus TaxID=34317 RepID=A0ABD3L912_EUCGL